MARTENPAPLTVAASLVAVEGMVVLALGVVALADRTGDTLEVGVPVAVFATLYAVLLIGAGWALNRRHAWARGPALVTQLLVLAVAWTIRDTGLLAAVLLVSGVVIVIGLLHPASFAALSREPDDS